MGAGLEEFGTSGWTRGNSRRVPLCPATHPRPYPCPGLPRLWSEVSKQFSNVINSRKLSSGACPGSKDCSEIFSLVLRLFDNAVSGAASFSIPISGVFLDTAQGGWSEAPGCGITPSTVPSCHQSVSTSAHTAHGHRIAVSPDDLALPIATCWR